MKENENQDMGSNTKTKTLPVGESFKLIGKGVVSNQACLDSGHIPWYLALLVFVISIVFSAIPVVYKGYTTDNSAIFDTTNNAEIDKGFKTMLTSGYSKQLIIDPATETLDMSGLSSYASVSTTTASVTEEYNGTNLLELAKGEYLDVTGGVDANFKGQVFSVKASTSVTTTTGESQVFYVDTIHLPTSEAITDTTSTSTTSTSSSTTYENNGYTTYLMSYLLPDMVSTDKNYTTFLNNFIATVVFDMDAGKNINNYPHSFSLITKDRIYVYVYALKSAKTNTTLASFTGSLTDGFKADSNLTSKISLNAYLFPEGASLTDGYKSFRNLMNNAVRASAIVALWTNVGYLAAIYAGTVLISALILLIMHKRKTSINRNVNYFNTLFEAIVFALTPAVLALILGFFSYTYGIMILIGGVLIRVVWSSSKLMPPVTEEDNKPLYQARS
jgi:hypothetical protein